jgi:hypothetical protein
MLASDRKAYHIDDIKVVLQGRLGHIAQVVLQCLQERFKERESKQRVHYLSADYVLKHGEKKLTFLSYGDQEPQTLSLDMTDSRSDRGV